MELRDGSGRVIDAMSYGDGQMAPAPKGQSLARFLVGAGAFTPWQPSQPDPGCLQAPPSPPPTETWTPAAEPTLTATPGSDATPAASIPEGPGQQALYTSYMPLVSLRAQAPQPPIILISEVLYDGTTGDDGDEFVELRNFTSQPLPLAGYKLGDAERAGDGEGMY
ncbi:MAG: lamin tail domain-containing protein, partial [Anaerolineae bacterium]